MRLNLLIRLFLVVAALQYGRLHAQSQLQQPLKPEKFVRTWLLCGPFSLEKAPGNTRLPTHLKGYENDYLAPFGGEANLRVKAGDQVKTPGGTLTWKLHTTPDSIIDLRKTLTREFPVFAYAYTEIISEQDKTWFVAFGTNDGGSLWVNGIRIWDYPTERGLRVDHDQIPVRLKKGVNKLLLKVEQHANRWDFCLRFKSFSPKLLAEKGEVFRMEAKKDGTVALQSMYAEGVLGQMLSSVEVTVTNSKGQEIWKERRSSQYTGPVKLPETSYQAYTARYLVRLKDGSQFTQTQRFNAGVRSEYVLFDKGKTAYSIALADDASESEKWAAKELQHVLKEASGVEFAIKSLAKSTSPRIVVGYNTIVKAQSGLPQPELLDESFKYGNSGADILIFGGKQRGTMYGVMSFLERELGCRWYTPGVTHIPKRARLQFDQLGHGEKPGIRVRNDFYYEAFDPTWAAHNRMNGSMGAPVQPGGVESYWSVHTFYPLVPQAEFFHDHPEYYSLLGGKRVSEGAQLCLSNPDVLRIIKERIAKRMRESPEYLIYDVSQNDFYNPCECDQCQAIVKREGSESGIMIWFVNQVAESVEKEFPDKFIGTLAYQYTRNPPKSIRPRENVVVRFCSIECCFSHDFKSCPKNGSFMDDLQTWSKMAPHMYIWDYVVNFGHYLMPYPNFAVLQPNIKTFQENNAIGIMEQAAYQSRGGEFAELRAYVVAKLLWNPDADVPAVINDFMYGYYGRSGALVREYFDLLQARVTPDRHIDLSTDPAHAIFSDEFVRQADAIFKEALRVADNDDVLHRVEMAYASILYVKCKRTPVIAHYDGSYKKLCEIVEREKITHFSEPGPPLVEAFHSSMKLTE